MNLNFMIGLAANKLKEFLIEQGGIIELTEQKINDYLKTNNYPFRVLCLDDVNKGKVIKIILEKK